jgi:hypothetical protein
MIREQNELLSALSYAESVDDALLTERLLVLAWARAWCRAHGLVLVAGGCS